MDMKATLSALLDVLAVRWLAARAGDAPEAPEVTCEYWPVSALLRLIALRVGAAEYLEDQRN